LPIIKTLPDRLRQMVNLHMRPAWRSIDGAIARGLAGRLAAEDSAAKTAVIFGASDTLADTLGLHKARRLRLPYPDFTLDNLALLTDEYDFVVTDRMLHLSDNLDDAGRETVRILKPGGWFVHVATPLDFSIHGNIDARRFTVGGLRTLFPHSRIETGGTALARWAVGRKNADAPPIEPTLTTRRARYRWYRCRPRPARVGVVTIIKNEAPYLLEWIAHYRVLRFEQITIYDNGSNDASHRILAPLARAGVINVVRWRDRQKKQRKAYNNARRRLLGIVEWCLFIDLDEFLVLDPGFSIDDLLPKEPDVAGIVIPWRFFGSSGLRHRDTGLTIERFLMALARNDRHVKALARLSAVHTMQIHVPKSYDGRLIDLEGNTIPKRSLGLLAKPAGGPARLHHYFSRSWEEFLCKRMRGRGGLQERTRSAHSFDAIGPGTVELRDALRLAPAVKQEIARLREIVGRY